MRCPVCRGSKTIRLSLHRELSLATFRPEATESVEAAYRDYPCPECNDRPVAVENIVIARRSSKIYLPALKEHPEAERMWRSSAAYELIDELLRQNLIVFRDQPEDKSCLTKETIATIACISRDFVETLETKIQHHQEKVARAVVIAIEREVQNWGSFYGSVGISKQKVYDICENAMASVLRDVAAKAKAVETVERMQR